MILDLPKLIQYFQITSIQWTMPRQKTLNMRKNRRWDHYWFQAQEWKYEKILEEVWSTWEGKRMTLLFLSLYKCKTSLCNPSLLFLPPWFKTRSTTKWTCGFAKISTSWILIALTSVEDKILNGTRSTVHYCTRLVQTDCIHVAGNESPIAFVYVVQTVWRRGLYWQCTVLDIHTRPHSWCPPIEH